MLKPGQCQRVAEFGHDFKRSPQSDDAYGPSMLSDLGEGVKG